MANKKSNIAKMLRMCHSSFHEDFTHTSIGSSLTTEELLGIADLYRLSGTHNMYYLVEKKHRFHMPSLENNTPFTYLQRDFKKFLI